MALFLSSAKNESVMAFNITALYKTIRLKIKYKILPRNGKMKLTFQTHFT